MPTMTSKKLEDLVYERESILLHERRIVAERELILSNVRAHLDQLDLEIVRLGGKARRHLQPTASECDEGAVSSIVPFPSGANGGSQGKEQGKRPRGRPRKSEEEKRKKSKKLVPTHVLVPRKAEEENASSPNNAPPPKDSVPSSNDEARKDQKSKQDQTGDAKSGPSKKKRKRRSSTASVDPADLGEPWTCECGEHLAAGRKRCGKCRRWKGGQRETRWSRKSVDEAKASKAGKASSGSDSRMPRAIEVYRDLPAAKLKSAAGGGLKLAGSGELEPAAEGAMLLSKLKSATGGNINLGNAAAKDPRSEVESIMGQMVLAVVIAAPIQTKARGSETSIASSKNDGSATNDGAARKRGRPGKEPKKEPGETHGEIHRAKTESEEVQREIQRVVSTSDDDNAALVATMEGRELTVTSAAVAGPTRSQTPLGLRTSKDGANEEAPEIATVDASAAHVDVTCDRAATAEKGQKPRVQSGPTPKSSPLDDGKMKDATSEEFGEKVAASDASTAQVEVAGGQEGQDSAARSVDVAGPSPKRSQLNVNGIEVVATDECLKQITTSAASVARIEGAGPISGNGDVSVAQIEGVPGVAP